MTTKAREAPIAIPGCVDVEGAGVELERTCTECDGEGIVYAPEWREWSAACDASGMSLDEYQREHPMPEGPEEVECGECDGSGFQLTQAGYDLLAFMRRHGR